MARYDVFPNPSGRGFLLDVQADLLDGLNTRVVVPLMPLDSDPSPARRLNPVFEIEGKPHVMVTQFLSAVPRSILKTPVENLGTQFSEITVAIDMLTQGY